MTRPFQLFFQCRRVLPLNMIQLIEECHHLLKDWMDREHLLQLLEDAQQYTEACICRMSFILLTLFFSFLRQELVCSCDDWELILFVSPDGAFCQLFQASIRAVCVLVEALCLLRSWTNVHEVTKPESPEGSTSVSCLVQASGFIFRFVCEAIGFSFIIPIMMMRSGQGSRV